MLTRLVRRFSMEQLLKPFQVLQDGNLGNKSSLSCTTNSEIKFTPDQVYYDFTCTNVEYIPDFHLTSYFFNHNKTGAKFWYLDRNDPDNVFAISFRTTPFDSMGLPHVLEHNVLCGSKKYPIKDPFFHMKNRSMATFMNAFTSSDCTIYPFSTMNETDFRNLQKVYLDAVFRPNLDYLSFIQEGWRLEHSNIHDKNSEMTIKGVVYNEMKGSFSDNDRIFGVQLVNNILPDHTYAHVSGGLPLEIPKMTHYDLVEFHKLYYHPSNAQFFCYGNFDVHESLAFINEEYLSKYDKICNSFSKIPNQKRWTEPRNVHISCRYDCIRGPIENQNQIAISLLMADITKIYETFILEMLFNLFVIGPNSSFSKSLVEPNLTGGFNKNTNYSAYTKDTIFSIGFQNVKIDDFSRIQEMFDNTINEVICNGFETDHIEGILQRMELSCKHQTPRFGLGILYSCFPVWNHEGEYLKLLKVNNYLKRLRNDLQNDSTFLQKKVEKYFKNNYHRLILTMSPDEHYDKIFLEAENKLIKSVVKKLSSEEKDDIYEWGLQLEKSLKTPPNLEILPTLSVEDVKKSPKIYDLEPVYLKMVPTQICAIQTNYVSYLKCMFNANHLTDNEIYLLPLFCDVINGMGTKNYDPWAWDKAVRSYTSGIRLVAHLTEETTDNKAYQIRTLLSTYSLDQNVEKMMELCHQLLCHFKMDDKEQFSMFLVRYLSNISNDLTSFGHIYAIKSSEGLVTSAGKLKSLLSGIEHIELMKNLVRNKKIEDIMTDLSTLGSNLINANVASCAINTSEDYLNFLVKNLEHFIDKLPKKDFKSTIRENVFLQPSCKHFIMNIPVNFCAKSFQTVPLFDQDHPTLNILSNLITAKYLLPVIRRQNGAYGVGARIGINGVFSFYSYRDPQSKTTLETFDKTYDWIQNNKNEINEQALFEAKLGVLKQLDVPIAPGNVGSQFFLHGINQLMFYTYREEILNVTINSLFEVVDKYFKEKPKHAGKCVIGPENNELQNEHENWSVRSL